ncbi:MAG: RNA polymerase sigma factor [Clostridia bacterium]|nr:RNA polymerase sigma factor [Clostridia bacterium]
MRIDRDNFSSTYDKYKNTVYSVIFNYVRNRDDAMDLMQEVFIKLLGSSMEFDSEEHVKAWLIRVSSNLCKNHLRDQNHYSDEEVPEQPYYDTYNEGDSLLEYVLKLPEKYRVPLHLFYYEDFSTRQIAETLNIPEATVRIHLKRGREKLKKLLKDVDLHE